MREELQLPIKAIETRQWRRRVAAAGVYSQGGQQLKVAPALGVR